MMNIAWKSPERLARLPMPAREPKLRGDAAPPLRSLGIEPHHYTRALDVAAGTTIELAQVIEPRLVTTRSLDEFKSWIGVGDALIDPATTPIDVDQVPERNWSGGHLSGLADLTAAERAEVEKAANLYVFSYSPWAESYRGVIETCYAPFRARVYAIRTLRIGTGARLVVDGEPSVLLVDDLVLEGGGQLALYTASRLWINRLTRLG